MSHLHKLLIVAAVLSACTTQQPSFYDSVGTSLDRPPGDVLRSEPFPGAPDGATAIRLLYASTTPEAAPIAVSGFVVVPATPAPPGGRPVLAWLHPTTGVARGCAPSLRPAPFTQIQGLHTFLAAGYAVVATDYPGLGGPGTHPYDVGTSEARAALDSVRAVLRLPEVQASHRFAAWGHSQGGQAVLFTAAIAPRYAPELELVGVAAAAPVTDLAALIEQPGKNPLWGALTAYTVWSWSRIFGLDPDAVIAPSTRATIARTAEDCLETGAELKQLTADAASLRGQAINPQGRWRDLLLENAPKPWAINAPVFIAQGTDDPVIVPMLTQDFARRLCAANARVHLLMMPGVDHYTIGMRSADAAADWIADRFASKAPLDDCLSLALKR